MRSYLPLLCLLLVSLCLPPVLAHPNSQRLLTQIASHAPHPGERVLVDVYDPRTRQTYRLQGRSPEASTPVPGAAQPGPELMPPNPNLLRDPAKALRIRATQKAIAKTPGLNAPGWGPGPLDRLQPRAAGAPAVTGTWRALVLLVDFSDKTPVMYPGSAGPTHYNSMLFDNPPYTNSVHDFYKECSGGLFDLTGAAVGGANNWYRAPQTYAYYVNSAYGTGTYPQNSQKMVEDIAAMADADVDFSQYANDGSDYINALFVVHAGIGAEVTGNTSDMWSHKWQTQVHPVLDGKILSTYSVEPEDGLVGVFCHEFGHVLGLPDLYDTDYSSEGVGNWSLMAGGSWGGGGALPTYLDAWCRYQLGWLTPIVPTSQVLNAQITQVEGSPLGSPNGVLYKLWCGPPTNEYWLVENRQQVGFDASIPSPGLLIWHIDESMPDNDTEWYPPLSAFLGHYLVALEQADGRWQLEHNTSPGDFTDPWRNNITGFTPTSVPDSHTYGDVDSLVSVANISASGTIMTADIKVGDVPPGAAKNVMAADTVGDSGGSMTVTWGLSSDDGHGFNDVTQYDIMRAAVPEGPFTSVGTVAKGTKIYTDTTVTDYVEYYYEIVCHDAVNTTASSVAGPAVSRDDTAPLAVTVSGGDTPGDAGGSISLSWGTYTPPIDFKEYRLYRSDKSFTDVSSLTPIKVINSSGTRSYQDKTTVDNHDYYYAVTCADTAQPANELRTVTSAGPMRSNPNYSFAFTPGLSLMSVGLTLTETDPGALFDLTHGASLSRWDPEATAPDGSTTGAYHQYLTGTPDLFLAQAPGRGYWLRATQPAVLNLSGAAAATNIRIPFVAGWNQLGNPYVSDTDVLDASVIIGGTTYSLDQSNDSDFTRNYMWGYDGARKSYVLISADLPFSTPNIGKGAGFFFLGLRDGQLILKNPATATSAVAASRPQSLSVDWSVRIVAETENAADTDNFLGVCAEPDRANGILSPPAAVDNFDFSFTKADGAGAHTATSFVKSLGTGQQWQAEVTCTRPGAQVKLNWPDLSVLPRDCRPILRDVATGASVYMRTSNGYSFALRSGETRRRFVIDISPKAGELLAIRSLQTGSGGGGAQIFYTLSAPAAVDIEIINLAGRAVRRLQSGTPSSGACTAAWDGSTDSGSKAPAGTYLVRLSARSDDGQAVNAVQALALRK